jgi:hypothetical protein
MDKYSLAITKKLIYYGWSLELSGTVGLSPADNSRSDLTA